MIEQNKTQPYTAEQLAWVQDCFGVSEAIARLLLARGLQEQEQIAQFLKPETMPDGDPFRLGGMDGAVAIIRDAIVKSEKICIYGDYDADGICATAILLRCLRGLGADAAWFIPNRHGEGYGLNADRVKILHEQGVTCLVTVDNGIAAVDEVAYAKSLGMRVVVTDHHRAGEVLPAADAIVCASLGGYSEEVCDLCGAGVAFQLGRALGCESELPRCLPLVALATVADMVLLTRENRKLVRLGVAQIGQNVGLLALQRAAGAPEGACDESALGFVLGPRLNVAGRMGDASRALRLLLCEDMAEAEPLAQELEAENRRRRAEEDRIFKDAESMLAEKDEVPPVILLYGADWSTGVMGIVASRLAERYYRPVLLFAERNGALAGSGRSISEVNLHTLLSYCADLLIRFGGHTGAAGLTIEKEQLPALHERACAWMREQFGEALPVKTLRYDLALNPEACTLALCRELKLLSPFGRGNEEPIFLLSSVALSGVTAMGDGRHLRASLGEGRAKLRLAAFGAGENQKLWQGWHKADALVRLRVNSYKGSENCNAYHIFLQKCVETVEKEEEFSKIVDAFYENIRYNKVSDYFDSALAVRAASVLSPKLTDVQLRNLYRQQRERMEKTSVPRYALAATMTAQAAALVFAELGFFCYDAEDDSFSVAENVTHRSLRESKWFAALS